MSKNNNVRRLALETLIKIDQGAYSSLELNHLIEQQPMDPRDVALLTQIVYGVLQTQLRLNYQLAPFLKNHRKVESWVKILLQTALYQMTALDRVPQRAIFNETIQIAKQKGHDGIRRMVTGILHQIQRSQLRDPNQIQDPIKRLAVQFSVPVWLIKQLNVQLGWEKAVSIVKTIDQPAKQSVRINLALTNKADLVQKLKQANYQVNNSQVSTDALILSGRPANQSQAFRTGLMTIQDESAMLPVDSMPIQEDQVILDACSAPGGKTTQIAEHLTTGSVMALDLHANRLRRVKANAKRMGVNNRVHTLALDAREVDDHFKPATFDQILVDAPCSGLGLIRRKPEIRYEKCLADVKHLHDVQLGILNRVVKALKVGGQLTYSTCTILQQENADVITDFLKQHPNFKVKPVETTLIQTTADQPLLKIYPDDYQSDGFFVCNLVKERD